MEAIMRLKDL